MRRTARSEIFGEIEDLETWTWIFEINDEPHGYDCPYCYPDGPPPRAGNGWTLMEG